jgi:hypothetical protein
VTIFDEPNGNIVYRDDSLDKATKLKTFKIQSVRRLAASNERLKQQQREIQKKRRLVERYGGKLFNPSQSI